MVAVSICACLYLFVREGYNRAVSFRILTCHPLVLCFPFQTGIESLNQAVVPASSRVAGVRTVVLSSVFFFSFFQIMVLIRRAGDKFAAEITSALLFLVIWK